MSKMHIFNKVNLILLNLQLFLFQIKDWRCWFEEYEDTKLLLCMFDCFHGVGEQWRRRQRGPQHSRQSASGRGNVLQIKVYSTIFRKDGLLNVKLRNRHKIMQKTYVLVKFIVSQTRFFSFFSKITKRKMYWFFFCFRNVINIDPWVQARNETFCDNLSNGGCPCAVREVIKIQHCHCLFYLKMSIF